MTYTDPVVTPDGRKVSLWFHVPDDQGGWWNVYEYYDTYSNAYTDLLAWQNSQVRPACDAARIEITR